MKKHSFAPSLDGRLEDRIVLSSTSAAALVANASSAAVLTTQTYNSVLVGIHNAVVSFGRSHGTDADYARLSNNVARQLNRLPYAQQEGLTSYVTGSLQNYAPSEFRVLYSDIRSSVVSYLGTEVQDGRVVIRKSPGRYFSDSDIYGPHAAIYGGAGNNNGGNNNTGGNGGNNNTGGNGAAATSAAVLTTRDYNSILVGIHSAVVNFGRSHGTDADYARLSNNVARQLNRLPYAQQEGLTSYVTGSLKNYAPSEYKILYSDIRSTIVSYLGTEVQDGRVAIHKSPGRYFSDSDIYGPHAAIHQS